MGLVSIRTCAASRGHGGSSSAARTGAGEATGLDRVAWPRLHTDHASCALRERCRGRLDHRRGSRQGRPENGGTAHYAWAARAGPRLAARLPEHYSRHQDLANEPSAAHVMFAFPSSASRFHLISKPSGGRKDAREVAAGRAFIRNQSRVILDRGDSDDLLHRGLTARAR
jgi:hypothetical protein